jgi:hypothetical protein
MKLWGYSLCGLMLLAGCATETGSSEAVDVEAEPVVLADIVIEGEHRVRFVETMPGAVSTSETGMTDPESSRLAGRGRLTLPEKYAALGVPIDAQILERLKQAQVRVDALNAELDELSAQGLGPEPEALPTAHAAASTSSDVASKKQGILTNSVVPNTIWVNPTLFAAWCARAEPYDFKFCAINQTSWNSGWHTEVAFSYSFVANAGTSGNVTHNHWQFKCVRSLPVVGCIERQWRVVTTQTVPVGAYGLFEDTYKWTKWSATVPSTTKIHVNHLINY